MNYYFIPVPAAKFLANTYALIIDLRKNHGGEPALVALMSSYFFAPEPIHFGSFCWRATESIQQIWTLI